MKRLPFLLLALLFFAVGCSTPPGLPSPPTAVPSPMPSPTPVVYAEDTARAYLKAWSERNYDAMYALLTPKNKETLASEQFTARYRDAATEATVKSIQPTLISAREEGNEAEVKFTVTIETNAAGILQQDNSMALRRLDNRWGVVWQPGLILTQLSEGGSVRFIPVASPRADIFDRKGRPLTAPQQQVVVEVVPFEMKDEGAVLAALGKVFNLQPGAVKALYSKFPRDWRTPVGALSPEQAKSNAALLNQPGIHTDTTRSIRTYPSGTNAAHVVGYAGEINADELERLKPQGYREGDIIGKTGLEQWGEPYLAGQRGGKLLVLSPSGAITATLASIPAQPSENLYTTLDADAQAIAEKALGEHTGAAVVMDVTNGNVLAMVSHPSFDPNKLSQRTSPQENRALLNDPNRPFLNRATQSSFPPGSVFKIISYSAALEKGGFKPTNTFEDPGYWDGLGVKNRRYGWTWETTKSGHGTLTLATALTVSCDVTFYQVGQKLDQLDRNLLPAYARAFGLGTNTGIELPEVPGNVPDPNAGPWGAGDPINMVIGQGTLLVSPLQIADILAAVANGGTLYRPRLVTRIGTRVALQPQVRGTLPISAATLASLRDGLRKVTTDPNGTAYSAFRGSKVISAGKTGTAEVLKDGEPHAWFAGYAPADQPRIAVVVFVEHGGEGSKAAAPIFREIVEKYLALTK